MRIFQERSSGQVVAEVAGTLYPVEYPSVWPQAQREYVVAYKLVESRLPYKKLKMPPWFGAIFSIPDEAQKHSTVVPYPRTVKKATFALIGVDEHSWFRHQLAFTPVEFISWAEHYGAAVRTRGAEFPDHLLIFSREEHFVARAPTSVPDYWPPIVSHMSWGVLGFMFAADPFTYDAPIAVGRLSANTEFLSYHTIVDYEIWLEECVGLE